MSLMSGVFLILITAPSHPNRHNASNRTRPQGKTANAESASEPCPQAAAGISGIDGWFIPHKDRSSPQLAAESFNTHVIKGREEPKILPTCFPPPFKFLLTPVVV